MSSMSHTSLVRDKPRRWRGRNLRKPREWHGKRIQCIGRVGQSPKQVDLPITKVNVDAKVIFDTAFQVTLTQTFQHNFRATNEPMTVSYLFPLEATSAVYSMRAILSSGVEIEGIIKEKEEAKQEFDSAVRSGHQAVLVSQVSGDIFQFDVGNVSPGESVDIIVSYMTILEYDNTSESIRVFLPRSITPRFGATDLSSMSCRINYQMTVHVDVRSRTPLQNVQCTSHPHELRVTRDPSDDRHMMLSLAVGVDSDGMEKDIVVLISEEDPQQTTAVYEFSNTFKTHAFLVSFVAQPMDFERCEGGMEGMEDTKTGDDVDAGDNSGVELIFLIDRSGSMGGTPIATVKKTLKKFLRSMPEKCKFNMISFNNSHDCFRPQSVVYGDETFDAADQWIDRLTAEGGTELYPALNHVLKAGYDPLRARNVFVLTDGAVSNTKKCIELVDGVGDDVRVFTFGIGSGHSTELVKGMAQAGNGTSTAIMDLNDVGSKVVGALTAALQPVVGDLNVMIQSPPNEGSPLKFDIFPRRIPAMFFGRRTVFYAVAHESVDISSELGLSVTITGRQNGHKPYKMEIPIDVSPYSDEGDVSDSWDVFAEYFGSGEGEQGESGEMTRYFGDTRTIPRAMQLCAARSDGLVIHRLAARARIQELEHRCSDVSAARKKKEIIALATRFNLASTHTSFIAVHRDREGNEREGDALTVQPMDTDVRGALKPAGFRARTRYDSRKPTTQRRPDHARRAPRFSRSMPSAECHALSSRYSRAAAPASSRSRTSFGVAFKRFDTRSVPRMAAPQSVRIEGVKCPCGATFEFVDAASAYGSGIECDVCSRTYTSGTIYHCPNGRAPEHADGYDLCPSCARESHHPSATRKCDCGGTLKCVSLGEIYNGGGAACDGCDRTVNQGVVYHCPRGRVRAHQSGFDLCQRCATGKRDDHEARRGGPSSVDELTDLQMANGAFRAPILKYAGLMTGLRLVIDELAANGVFDDEDERERVRATLLALGLLNRFFHAERGEWRLIERKAIKFISNATERPRSEIASWVQRFTQEY